MKPSNETRVQIRTSEDEKAYLVETYLAYLRVIQPSIFKGLEFDTFKPLIFLLKVSNSTPLDKKYPRYEYVGELLFTSKFANSPEFEGIKTELILA